MMRTIRLPLAAVLAITAVVVIVVVMAQNRAPLSSDDIVGVWNLTYDDGTTGTFTVSRKGDAAKVMVTTTFGKSEARDVVIEGDTITFHREVVDGLGQTLRIDYRAKLADGKLEGTGKRTGLSGELDGTAAFTATRAE
jgi:hypothetical protein